MVQTRSSGPAFRIPSSQVGYGWGLRVPNTYRVEPALYIIDRLVHYKFYCYIISFSRLNFKFGFDFSMVFADRNLLLQSRVVLNL